MQYVFTNIVSYRERLTSKTNIQSMKKYHKIVFVSLMSICTVWHIKAQEIEANYALTFLMVNPDARTSSSGAFGISNADNSNTIYHNFSLSPFLQKDKSFGLSFMPSFTQREGQLFAFSTFSKLKNKSTIGLSARYVSYDQLNFIEISGNPSSSVAKPIGYELSAAYALPISDNFSVGIRPKFIFSNVATGAQVMGFDVHSGKSMALDFSLSYYQILNSKGDRFTMGLSAANIGRRITYVVNTQGFELPFNVGIGASYKRSISTKWNTLISLGYANRFKDNDILSSRWSIGNEIRYNDKLSIRTGYTHEKVNSSAQHVMSLGTGIQLKTVSIDFAYFMYSQSVLLYFDNHIRLSAGIQF